MDRDILTLNVNGSEYSFVIGVEVDTMDSLSHVLRNKIGLTGVRVSCEQGACGACTILFDGKSALSCMMPAVEAEGHYIRTIEDFDGEDDVVKAFVEMNDPGYGTTMQCGFCTPGFVLETHSLLAENPRPDKDEIKDGLSGHVCRCGCYHGIVHAVGKVADQRNCNCKEGEE